MQKTDHKANALILQLREEISLLREENHQLREAFVPKKVWPKELGVTPTERSILNCLLASRGKVLTRAAIHDWIYFKKATAPNDTIIDVFVCKIRVKLEPHGIAINTEWGTGYYIDVVNAQKLQDLIDNGVEPQATPVG